MKCNFSFTHVALAIDNRPSSYAMAQACALRSLGIDVLYSGVVPTPTLAFIAQEDTIPAIMVTGSHIPFDHNSLTFYRPDGEISKEDEKTRVAAQVEFIADQELMELTELLSNI